MLRTPHFMAALAAVGASDAVTTISQTLARRFAGVFGLALLDPPFADVPLHFRWSARLPAPPIPHWSGSKA